MNVMDFWEEESAVAQKRQGRILLVDDELDVREGMARLLRMEGYEVTAAENGIVALERAKSLELDLALTDLRMPGISGVETLIGLKKLHPDLPVIIVTGFASDATAANCMREGAYGFVTKPFDLNYLLNVIGQAIDTGKRRQIPS